MWCVWLGTNFVLLVFSKLACDVYGDERLHSSKTLEMSYCITIRDPVNRAYTGCYSRCLLTLGNIGILCLLYVALVLHVT